MILDFQNLSDSQLKSLNSIPLAIHQDFNAMTSDILLSTPKKIADLVSIVASRHPYQSCLFDICIKLELVRRYLDNEKGTKRIITKDIELYKILKQSNLDCELNFDKTKNKNYLLGSLFTQLKRVVRVLLITITELSTKDKSRRIKLRSSKSIVLIDTFMLQNSIVEEKYIDRYYTGLQTYLEEDLKKNIFFLPHIIGKYSRRGLREIYLNTDENIVFKQDFLKLIDYFKAIGMLFKHRVKAQSKIHFKEFNITDLVKKTVKEEKFNASAFEAILNYFFIKRLKEVNVDLKLVIDWNENQPVDKGLIRGVHDFYPQIKVKGYRAFIISSEYNLYLMPTQYEIDNKVIPDEIIVIGNGLVDEVKSFCKDIKVSVGPAFRFMNINKPTGTITKNNSILVALPIGFENSFEIIKTLGEVEKYNDLIKYNIIIRPHPTTSVERLKREVKDIWKTHYSWAEGQFRDNVLQSSLFISNTSSSIIESLAYGVPGIIVGSRTSITQNPLPKTIDQRMWRVIYTAKELAKEIDYFINLEENKKQRIIELGAKIKKDFFGQVTKEGVKQLLDI